MTGRRGEIGRLRSDARKAVVVQLVLVVEPATVVDAPEPSGHPGEEDRGLGRLTLAEEGGLVAARRSSRPMSKQLAAVRRDAVVVFGPPPLDLATDVVDQRVLLPPPRDVKSNDCC